MIDLAKQFIDTILHVDVWLLKNAMEYNTWIYLILFAIVFCETGLIVTPFLPGDSLLFAAGTLAASTATQPAVLSIWVLIGILMLAAILGDNTNYWIGRFLGSKVYEKNYKLINRKNLDKTHQFYEKHGGKTVIIARFMPIVRTFAPFVAGIGTMKYSKFFSFSFIGNILWVNSFCFAGFLFGNIPFVKNNFTIVVMTIIAFSLAPTVFVVVKNWLASRKAK
jgi:membrane-associated protein